MRRSVESTTPKATSLGYKKPSGAYADTRHSRYANLRDAAVGDGPRGRSRQATNAPKLPTIDHILHHAPNDMLTVIAVGLGLAAIAIGVLRLVSTTRGDKT